MTEVYDFELKNSTKRERNINKAFDIRRSVLLKYTKLMLHKIKRW